jgi:photosystem II stability/assembly factor-like uncharacterized protein
MEEVMMFRFRLVFGVIFMGVVLFFSFKEVFAQDKYLVKIDISSSSQIEKLTKTKALVYAKTSKFFVGEAELGDLDYLKGEGVSYQVLDEQPEMGKYYLIWSRNKEEIQTYLRRVEKTAEVLYSEDSFAIVKGEVFQAFDLPFLKVYRIPQTPLPLETREPAFLESFTPKYNALVDQMIDQVDLGEITGFVSDLSGENPVMIGGVWDTLHTRYSHSPKSGRAAEYLKEKLEGLGFSTEYHLYYAPVQNSFSSIKGTADGETLWIGTHGYGGLLKTMDGGSSWFFLQNTMGYSLNSIFFIEPGFLWGVGNRGLIVKSADRGESWVFQASGTDQWLNDVYFVDSLEGWAVGDYGTILHTTDGGGSWSDESIEPRYDYQAVTFVGDSLGWVVSASGKVVHTTDGGGSWSFQVSGTSQWLSDVGFVDSLEGWMVGGNGLILHTTDGGGSWVSQVSGTTYYLNSLCFLDSLEGWAVGQAGIILHTSDGGESWVIQRSGGDSYFGVFFVDSLRGWTVGGDDIFHTSDGGANWAAQSTSVKTWKNVVATLRGDIYPGRQCLIIAHYDAISEDPFNSAPGADDNASGTAAVLEAAKILKNYHFQNTVKFIAFSGEEQGLLGSYAYARDAYLRGDTILGVLNFDMIAWDGRYDDSVFVVGGMDSDSRALWVLLRRVISDYGIALNSYDYYSGSSGISDEASFIAFGYPAIFSSEAPAWDYSRDFNPYYHTTGERLWAFNLGYYDKCVKTAVGSIATLAQPFIIGDADSDGRLTLSDAILLANHVLKGGPPPDLLKTGDVDCNTDIDLADVVYLANHLLKGGPGPCQ